MLGAPAGHKLRLCLTKDNQNLSAWGKLAEKDLLPVKMRTAIGDQILSVAKSVAQATPK